MQAIFLLLGLITFLSAVMVVVSPQLIHAGLWLVLTLAGVAGLFVLLEAPFLAVVQVVIYIGAIAILIIFAIMLTRRMLREDGRQLNNLWAGAVTVSLILFTVLTFLVLQEPSLAAGSEPLQAETAVLLQDLGRSMVDVDRFIIPFEVASILLLAALIGAIYVARPMMASEEGDREE
jgi:NADH-quinone oxidoreductase subunit J